MNERRTFWWKVGYIVAIAILVVPLHMLSLPATRDSPGGILAKLRTDNGLAEANLGEIDASAETVKLATLGLRGVAVNLLWEKANYYKKVEDWTNFGTVLTQIAYLQPHFYSVWEFQAHNLTYNTSVEFDDYKDRYDWVIKGIDFLKKGKSFNTNPRDERFTEPRITKSIGWFISNKIGKADEHRQYRRLFKEDDRFHAADNPNRKPEDRDNWLVGAEYYRQAWEEVSRGAPLRTTPVLFYSNPSMSLIYYADALESDSTAGETPRFGEKAQQAWKNAAKALTKFSRKDIPSTYGGLIHLEALDELVAREKQIETQLQKLLPGQFEKLERAERKTLTPEQVTSLKTPIDKRNGGQQTVAFQFWQKVAEQAPAAQRGEALKLTDQFEKIELKARDIRSSRGIVNYTYWKTRCEAEPTDAALSARRWTYMADHERQEARPNAARKYYVKAFAQWRKVLDRFDVLRKDTLMAEDLAQIVDHYRSTLRQLAGNEAKFPEPFILQDMLDLNERVNGPSEDNLSEPKATTKSEHSATTKDAGKKETGKKETGKKETGKKETGKKETGKKETGKKETGKKETGKKETGKKETGKKETGKKETEKPVAK